jgi:transposase
MGIPADLVAQADRLAQLVRTDPSPQVRRRAQCLLTWTHCPSLATAVTQTQSSRSSLSRWRARFLAAGRDGLADQVRPGRPCKLPPAGDTLLETALAQPPTEYGYATACWTLADLQDLLARQGWRVAIATVERHLHRLGYVYRRPRHDLAHRQNADAVASAAAVLTSLREKGVLTMADSISSISTSAISIPIRTWLPSGSDGGPQP